MAVAKKLKAVTHRQQSTKIGSRINNGGSGNGDGNNNGDNYNGNGDRGNDDNNDGGGGGQRVTAAIGGMVWGRCHAARDGRYGNKVETGTMWV